MRQISVSQFSTCHWTFEEDLLRYQALGFDSIGIWRQKIDDFGHRDAIDMLYDSKLNVSSLSWAGGFTGSDGRSHVEAIDDAYEAISLASKLNAGSLLVHPGARNKHTNSHAFRLLESALTRLVPVAEDYGVKLTIELIPGFVESPWTFIHSFAQIDRLLDTFPSEQLGLVLDLYHAGLNQPAFDRLDRLANRIDLVQLSDRNDASCTDSSQSKDSRCGEVRLLPGHGDVDISAWLTKLDALNYHGPIELEVHGAGVETVDYFDRLDDSYDYLQHLLPVSPSNPASRSSASAAELRSRE